MSVNFSLPVPISQTDFSNTALCRCEECGAAILIIDFYEDARALHAEWHERTASTPKAIHAVKKAIAEWEKKR